MKYIKKYESLYNTSNYKSIKKGDIVVYVDETPIGGKLKTGEKYIVYYVYDINREIIDSSNNKPHYFAVKDMKGNIIKDLNHKPSLYFNHRFMTELEYEANKYNI